ncbi:hypothetical protein PQ469_19655 [Mucilaginibacter sp. KACC 22773]|uniref:hypothetical protein n=1 Tax=Mucilaginibacter sp. KACC 22773 TaxID=3025671 RepID=UPI002365F939|nr:hypothetical protein [Mucilaginibacter sp. KACC 22773]WDF76109.1 hypothetical protein PQ469_19655 [Mucilaginibacter sp. KACC 22773]
MKLKLLLCLLLITNLRLFGSILNTDTLRRHQAKPVKKAPLIVEPPAVVVRRSVKGYKKQFDDCVFTNKYSAKQRLKMYPYTNAARILAVSFDGGDQPNEPLKTDTPKAKPLSYQELQWQKGLVISNNKLDYSTLIEVKTLSIADIYKLTNIIYNTDYKKVLPNAVSIGHNCFEPRNGIIFLNKKGSVIDYLEICFECKQYESKYNKLDVGEYCTQKFDMLRQFFKSVGVKYGTNPSGSNDHYVGAGK